MRNVVMAVPLPRTTFLGHGSGAVAADVPEVDAGAWAARVAAERLESVNERTRLRILRNVTK
jgi:hypothetical protein